MPGLKLSGNLERADLVLGFRTEGLFVRTEGAPLAFVGTSVSWAGKDWVKACDLAAGLDLLVGEKATILGFRQARFTHQGRVLAAGDLSLGLGEAKALVDGAPSNVLEGAKKEDAEKAKADIISGAVKVHDYMSDNSCPVE